MRNSITIGLLGYGKFGKLAASHLSKHFTVMIYHPSASPSEKLPKNCRPATLVEAAACDVVILAVNLPKLELLIKRITKYLRPGALVADVTSVKVKPVQIMKRYLPRSVQILATHPLFGPESATGKTLVGHKIIVYPIRVKNFEAVKQFLSDTLQLEVIKMTPSEHDRKMALVHGLTFFLARGLLKMQLPQYGLSAPSYQKLIGLAELERHHSPDLFKTIEAGNPYAANVRHRFIKHLERLHQQTLNGQQTKK